MTEQVEKIGINETLEILDGVKEAAIFVAKVASDKKISIADLQYVPELAKKFDVFKSAISGAEKAIGEAKDLDSTEAVMLVAKVYELIKSVKEAYNCPAGDCQVQA